MSSAIKDNSWPLLLSLGLHAALAAALVLMTLLSADHAVREHQAAPINAVVVDAQTLKSFERAQRQRAEEAERARAEAAAQAAAQAKAAEEAKAAAEQAAEQAKAAAEAKAAEEAAEEVRRQQAQAEEQARAAAARAAEEKRAAEAKQAAEAKAAEARRLAENEAKAQREAELKRQIAEEEHTDAVEASPLRDRYIASLRNRIQNAWIKPDSARVGVDCFVQVTQVPGGEVTGAHVTRCNGDAAVRQSIENAVYRASPLPEPPDPALFQRNLEIEFKPDE